jgi:pimeloyl-ACP methyl ester carboxylesterase
MKDKIPNAELFVIPKAAHLSTLEQPETVNEHILKFLKSLPA